MSSSVVMPAQPPGDERRKRRLALVGGSLGNLVEWYDWFVYASFAIYFADSFFPNDNPTTQLMNTAGIFAVGFLMRPVGGWILGRAADRHGRKSALTLTVTMMSVAALLIAVAPTYGQAGYFGALVLLLARLLQGMSIGGEYAASATYLTEASARNRRGLGSSFQYVSMTCGQLLGLGILITLQHTLTTAQLESWGWRLPFVIGALFAVVVFWLRRRLQETDAFKEESASAETGGEAHDDSTRGTLRALWQYRRQAGLVMALTLGGTVAYYTYTTYLTKYLVGSAGMEKTTATLVSFTALTLFAVLQPFAGMLSDRIGRRPLLITFAVGCTVGTYPIMTALGSASSYWSALGLSLLALVIITGYTSINAAVKAELFPTRVRALGVALPYAIANALFGGTAEYVALWFKNSGHETMFFWYVSGCALISLVTYVLMPDTRNAALSRAEAEADGDGDGDGDGKDDPGRSAVAPAEAAR
ncbi:MFS dicarboxylate transporter [Streptomyces avidinii]|uniref:MHS family alpha-ketoglutarate permease-like MFS transporter n=2 Tax=Streptomyces avidinii TaxID=1895 RepID=A0ABS4KWV7_STRAV|nr:MHS family alpha-ketoglutarate permease-like MFS transporter [Streptomyces avidinii]GGY86853.1 MFS dicarboxylate transporter [Streptomyces avidinii]